MVVRIGAGADMAVPMRLMPLKFDPEGAFDTRNDPIGVLCNAIAFQRALEEDIRMAYVAITRAARSVVLGLPERGREGAQDLLLQAWATPKNRDGQQVLPTLAGVAHAPIAPLPEVPLPPSGTVHPRAGATLPLAWRPPNAWVRQAPSHVHEAMTSMGKSASALGHAAAATCVLANGYQAPLYDPLPAPAGRPDEEESVLGTRVHAWFARWGFLGPADLDAICRALDEDWGAADSVLAAWLYELTTWVLAHPESVLWRLVTRPGVQLHFELPLVGVARFGATDSEPLLLSGRTDLLVRDPAAPPERRWTVVDFKAGHHSPRKAPAALSDGDLAKHLFEGANLRTYAPQLEAYREALNNALPASGLFEEHEQVGQVALC